MLILLPIFIIIMIIFTVDVIYFDEAKPVDEPIKKSIEKTDNRKNYINKYLKQ